MHVEASAEVLPLAARISALSDAELAAHVSKPSFRCAGSGCAASSFVIALADRLVEAGKALTRERLETAALRDEVERELAGGSRLGKRVAELEGEIASVDSILARRDALDTEPTREAKIQKAIRVAAETDALRAELVSARDALLREGLEVERLKQDLADARADLGETRSLAKSLLEGQEALRAQTVRIRRALCGDGDAFSSNFDTEEIARLVREGRDEARRDAVNAEANERTALDALERGGFEKVEGPAGWKPPLGPVPERFREENSPRVLDFAGAVEPKTYTGPVSLDELEEAIAFTRKGTELQAFREGVIAARDLTCPGCGEGAPLTLSGTHHRGGSAGCCTNLCKASAIRRELLGEEVGKIGTSRKIMAG